MVEEAAPLIEVDDEYRPAPRGAARHRRIDAVHHRFAPAHITMRMVVRPRPGQLLEETSIDERDVRKRPCRAVNEECADRTADRYVLPAPQPEEGHIREVVATVQSRRAEAIPDRGELRQLRIVGHPIRLRPW